MTVTLIIIWLVIQAGFQVYFVMMLKKGIQNTWDTIDDFKQERASLERRIVQRNNSATDYYSQLYDHMALMRKEHQEEIADLRRLVNDHIIN